jgi:phospholipid/cholesterol/gamma-HCH transport system ATP-binding protein
METLGSASNQNDTRMAAIELRHVSLAFEDHPVLDDVSFQLGAGETLVLLGVTGSGKSVLLKLILGLIKPDAGEVRVDGRDLVPLPESDLFAFRRRMGIVFQEGALFDSLSVMENVAYRLREDGENDEARLERRVREVLSFVEMEHAITKMPSELSGGMRRRVSIARAIASEPSIMLYDSPTGGLDPVTAHTINILIAKLRDVQNVTSLVVTHRLADAYALAHFVYSREKQDLVAASDNGGAARRGSTRFLVLRDGQTCFLGTTEEIVASPDPYVRKFLT